MSSVTTWLPNATYSGVNTTFASYYVTSSNQDKYAEFGFKILWDNDTQFAYEMTAVYAETYTKTNRWCRVHGPSADDAVIGGVFWTGKCTPTKGAYTSVNSGVWRYVYDKGHSAYSVGGAWRVRWYRDSACTDMSNDWHFGVTSNVSAKTSYTVKYAANGGSSTPGNQTKWYNENLTLAGAISRANASAGSYKVTLNGNGATNPNALTANRTTKYTFSSWKASNGTTYAKSATYSANAGTTMTAQWSSSTTTAAVTLPTPSRSGFSWVRWNTNSTNTGTGYSGGSSYTPSGNVTLYAIWNHSVTYNLNGGSGTFNTQTALATSAITLNSGKPTYTGYTFKRWNTNNVDTGTVYNPGGSLAVQAASVTLYAIWNRTVSYNANGGTGAPSSQTGIKSSAITLTSSKPSFDGHIFLEWNTAADGTGTGYQSGGSYPANNVTTTLYAIWGPEIVVNSVTRTDAQGNPDDLGGCVKVTASFKNLVSYSVTVGSVSVNTIPQAVDGTYSVIVPGTLQTFDPRNSYTVTVRATDSANNTSTVTTTLPVSRYAKPKIASILTQRCTADGVPGEDGDYMLLTLDWTGYPAPSQSITLSVRTEDEDGIIHPYDDEVLIAPGGTTSIVYPSGTDVLPSLLVNTEKQYLVTVRITDVLGYAEVVDIVSRAYFTMDVLGDAYLYQPSEDTAIDSRNTYYKPIDRRTAAPVSTTFVTTNAVSNPLRTLSPVYGATVQEGTPTTASPAPISCVRGIFDGENILPSSLNASSWTMQCQPSGSNMSMSDYENGVNLTWTGVSGWEVFRVTSGITVEVGKWYKLKCKYNINAEGPHLRATCVLGLSVRDNNTAATVNNFGDDNTAGFLGVAPFQTENGTELETSLVFRATASTIYLYVNGGAAADGYSRDIDVYDIELTSESIAIISEAEGSEPNTVYLDLKGNDLNALNDVYRDTLSVDENGHAVITKRTATIGLEGLTAYETVGSYKAVTHTFASNRKVYYPDNGKVTIAKCNYFASTYWGASWAPDKLFIEKANNKAHFAFDSSFAADLNAAKAKLKGFVCVYPLEESSWYTIDLGYITLPQVSDNSVVRVEAEIPPIVGGSWRTSVGTAVYGSEAYEKVDPYWSEWNNLMLSVPIELTETHDNYVAYNVLLSEWLEEDQTYTLQLWDVDVSHSGKDTADISVSAYYCGGKVLLGGFFGTSYFTDGHADHLTLTFTPHANSVNASTDGEHANSGPGDQGLSHSNVTGAAYPYIVFYNSPPLASGTKSMTIGSWKLEKGSESTDWTPCLSDVSPSDQGWHEKTGPKPGHGVSFGAPAVHEGFNIAMPPECYGEPWIPTYKTSSIANFVIPNGVEECLVYDASTGAFYCYSNGVLSQVTPYLSRYKGLSTHKNSWMVSSPATDAPTSLAVQREDTGVAMTFEVGGNGVQHGVYSQKLGWMVYADASNIYIKNVIAGKEVKTIAFNTSYVNSSSCTFIRMNGMVHMLGSANFKGHTSRTVMCNVPAGWRSYAQCYGRTTDSGGGTLIVIDSNGNISFDSITAGNHWFSVTWAAWN